jgi:hypothetical protein
MIFRRARRAFAGGGAYDVDLAGTDLLDPGDLHHRVVEPQGPSRNRQPGRIGIVGAQRLAFGPDAAESRRDRRRRLGGVELGQRGGRVARLCRFLLHGLMGLIFLRLPWLTAACSKRGAGQKDRERPHAATSPAIAT